MSNMAFKPKHDEFVDLLLEHSTFYEVDKLASVLAHHILQDGQYTGRFQYNHTHEIKKKSLETFLFAKNAENQFSITKQTVYIHSSAITTYSNQTVLKPVTALCVNLSEFANWAVKENFPCPQAILVKATIHLGNQHLEARETYKSDSPQGSTDQKHEGRENDDMAHQPEIAQDDETPAATKSPGREPGNFTKLVTHVFNKLPELKKLNLAKRSNIREFIILIKEMTTPNSRLSDTFVMDLVKSVTIPDDGPCTIMMNDYSKLIGENEIRIKGKKYNNNHVSQVISRVRKKLIKNNA